MPSRISIYVPQKENRQLLVIDDLVVSWLAFN